MRSGMVLGMCAAAAICLFAPTAKGDKFEIIALPDTEDYTDYYPTVFGQQTQWIADQKANENIVFVTHLGDTVHHPLTTPSEWTTATDAMYRLDGLVPYGVCAGNHDLEDPAGFIARFGPAHYSQYAWYGGSSSNKLNDYQVFSAGGYEFLHITLQKGPDAATRAWARDVIEANPGKPTIISTHDYLGLSGRTTAGNSIWTDLVNQHPQVFMVLNGHSRGINRMVSTDAAGRQVLQMLSNYQDYTTPGGETDTGYLRKIIFDPDNGRISVETYSPTYAGQPSLTGDAHQFSYDAAFLPQSAGTAASPILITDGATRWAATVGDWAAAGNWTAGTPAAGRDAYVQNGGTAQIASGQAEAGNLFVGTTAGSGGLELAAALRAGCLYVGPEGTLAGGPGALIELAGDFQNLSARPDEFDLAACTVRFVGAGGRAAPQLLEAASADRGLDPNGWAANFSLGRLLVAPGACVKLVDLHVSCPDGGAGEAVYVGDLLLEGPNAGQAQGWIVLDGVSLYYRNGGAAKKLFYGDADLDGGVTFFDYLTAKGNFGLTGGATWAHGDTDGDGDVDFFDYLTVKAAFGLTAAGGMAPLPDGGTVPEPGVVGLLLTARLLVPFLFRRRR